MCYSDGYNADFPSSTINWIRNSQCTKAKLMLGCRRRSSNTIQTLAWASRECVFTDTGRTQRGVTSCEGTNWYFSYSYSWGFVKQGDGVYRNSCDTDRSGCNDCRMCWHTPGDGYRCGADRGHSYSAFEKIIFQTGMNEIFLKSQPQAGSTLPLLHYIPNTHLIYMFLLQIRKMAQETFMNFIKDCFPQLPSRIRINHHHLR